MSTVFREEKIRFKNMPDESLAHHYKIDKETFSNNLYEDTRLTWFEFDLQKKSRKSQYKECKYMHINTNNRINISPISENLSVMEETV